ncbi:MAG TPA: DUF4936 family protein [Rhodocyclaceae bacterium]|nr:DUF4936 family protein [Rhodocyclaceae bacterium]
MSSFYVYYRIDLLQREAAMAAADAILKQVQVRCGIHGELLQRADDAATWMEVYEGITDANAFGRALDEITIRSGLLAALAEDSKRHIEHFRSVDSND